MCVDPHIDFWPQNHTFCGPKGFEELLRKRCHIPEETVPKTLVKLSWMPPLMFPLHKCEVHLKSYLSNICVFDFKSINWYIPDKKKVQPSLSLHLLWDTFGHPGTNKTFQRNIPPTACFLHRYWSLIGIGIILIIGKCVLLLLLMFLPFPFHHCRSCHCKVVGCLAERWNQFVTKSGLKLATRLLEVQFGFNLKWAPKTVAKLRQVLT